ncbi:MAG TPA: hypothetical protein VEI28_04095, partial [Thermodesulfovibrionales bacterium]|nr:hypothetical protein [Thermodesulfovibrionales bacterium]
MKSILSVLLCIAIGASFILVKGADALGEPLRSESANASEVAGIFTVTLFGGNYLNDLHTIAFLDL